MVTLLNGTDNLTDTAVFAWRTSAPGWHWAASVWATAWPSRTPKAPPSGSCSWLRDAEPAAALRHTGRQAAGPAGDDRRPRRSANDLHVQVLAELATLFSGHRFLRPPAESETPEAFCRAISAREEQDAQDRRLPRLTQRRVPPSPAISCWP